MYKNKCLRHLIKIKANTITILKSFWQIWPIFSNQNLEKGGKGKYLVIKNK